MGRLLSVRGRRQAGKSRLVTEFADRSGLPQLFFTATRLASPGEELARLAQAARDSTLPGAHLFDGITLDNWHAALRQVRVFESIPVLFMLMGSDLTMMEALTAYDRPLFGRVKECVVDPFTVADTAAMIGLDDCSVAMDAQLITGGYPRPCLEWRDTESPDTASPTPTCGFGCASSSPHCPTSPVADATSL